MVTVSSVCRHVTPLAAIEEQLSEYRPCFENRERDHLSMPLASSFCSDNYDTAVTNVDQILKSHIEDVQLAVSNQRVSPARLKVKQILDFLWWFPLERMPDRRHV